METLARFIISAVEVVEAEGRTLRRELVRLSVTLALTIIASLLMVTGLGFLFWGIFCALKLAIGPAWSAVLLGVVWMTMAWCMSQIIKSRI